MKIGFVGFGEAAYHISRGLRNEGILDIIAFDAMAGHETMGRLVKTRAAEAGVTLVDTARNVVEGSDLVFAAVPSTYSLDVARGAEPYLKEGQQYIDVSASTPTVKKNIWGMIKHRNVLFTDAAMLGSLPQDKHKVPITASGNGAKVFRETMGYFGMRITYLNEDPGAASAIKLVRSIYMKGIAALMFEMLQAADAYNICEELISSIATSFDGIPFREHLDRLVTGTAIHASRRAAELKGSIQMLEEIDIDAAMTIAAKHRHELLEGYRFNEIYALSKPKGYQDIIERLRRSL
jgi:3-hydroxyisobutyrate dehydrogenase-like beta-hydroxyacid dehydrogenase